MHNLAQIYSIRSTHFDRFNETILPVNLQTSYCTVDANDPDNSDELEFKCEVERLDVNMRDLINHAITHKQIVYYENRKMLRQDELHMPINNFGDCQINGFIPTTVMRDLHYTDHELFLTKIFRSLDIGADNACYRLAYSNGKTIGLLVHTSH